MIEEAAGPSPFGVMQCAPIENHLGLIGEHAVSAMQAAAMVRAEQRRAAVLVGRAGQLHLEAGVGVEKAIKQMQAGGVSAALDETVPEFAAVQDWVLRGVLSRRRSTWAG